MDLEPKPMSAERIAQLAEYASDARSWMDDDAHTLRELLADRAWHRARVQVTDDDIRAAGLGDPDISEDSPRLIAWARAQPSIWLVTIDNDHAKGMGYLDHGFWTGHPFVDEDAETIAACSPMAHDWIVNELARHVGRAPLDVLAEIAATEVPRG